MALLSRKYRRDGPGSTEKAVGTLILVLLALLVGTFLLTSGLLAGGVNRSAALVGLRKAIGISEKPLFVAHPMGRQTNGPSVAMRVGEALLPRSVGGWERNGVKTADLSRVMEARSGGQSTFFGLAMGRGVSVFHHAVYRQSDTDVSATVGMVDMGDPAEAFGLCETARPEAGETIALGCGGWESGQRIRLWAGRYCLQVESDSSGAARELAAGIAAGMLAYGRPFRSETVLPTEQEIAPSGVARFADVGGLDSPIEIARYTDNLYEKINGREPQFRAYHFVELRFGRYRDVERKATFDAYIFDMEAPVNAFGIYAKERSGVAGSVDIGRAGYPSGAATFFCKGKYYVYVLGPTDGGEGAGATSKRIAEAIAGTIADGDEPFWAESLLPVEDRLANTFSYQATSALSYDFLEGVFLAKYKTDDVPYQMFLLKAADDAEALFGRLAGQLEKSRYDKIVAREAIDGGETLVCDSLGYFLAAFRTGVYLGGVIECEDQATAVRQAEQLRQRLATGSPGSSEDG